MSRVEIERILAESLSTPLEPEELEELVRRVLLQEELAALLRALPLEEEEPLLPLPDALP